MAGFGGGRGSNPSDFKNVPQAGRLYVPPAYYQTTGDQAVALTSANHQAAFSFVPEIDIDLDSISLRVNAVSTQGDINLSLCADDGTAPFSSGMFNGLATASNPTMTANNAPSPYVVSAVDSAGANCETASYEAYRAMNGLLTGNGFRSNAAPTALAPIYWCIDLSTAAAINKIRIASTGDAFPKAWTFWGSNAESPTKNTDDDWTAITGPSAFTAETDPTAAIAKEYWFNNATAYRHYRIKFTDRTGSSAFVEMLELYLYAAQSYASPGTLIASLGAVDCGAAAGWIRKTFTAQRLERRKRYWIVATGTADKSYSLSCRRVNTAAGSAFPDSCVMARGLAGVTTSNGGTTYSELLQDNKPAMLNVIVNSTANHVPKLYYGRRSGRDLYIPGAGQVSIPAGAISLNLEALTAGTVYSVYGYPSSGVLTLEASTTVRTTQETLGEGLNVKTGAATYRFLGIVCPVEIQTGYRGPVDVEDYRAVTFYGNDRKVGKPNPYSSSTLFSTVALYYQPWNANDDWKVWFLLLSDQQVDVCALANINNAASQRNTISIGVDGISPHPDAVTDCGLFTTGNHTGEARLAIKGREQMHYVLPLFINENTTSGARVDLYYAFWNRPFMHARMTGEYVS